MNLTKSSFEILKQRLAAAQELNKEIVKEIEEARAQGDLSENADYSAAMEKKKANDALIAEYQREINSAIIVTDEIDTSKVNINSVVTVLRIKDNTTVHVDYRDYESEISLKGEFVRLVMADERLDEKRKAEIVSLGLKAIAGENIWNW